MAARFADGVIERPARHADGRRPAGHAAGRRRTSAAVVAAAQRPAITLVDTAAHLRQLSWTTYFASAMAILFLFFAVQAGMLSLFEERRQGTLARMLAGPIRPETILAGKALGASLTGVTSLIVLIVATTLLIGADWGPPPGVALLVVAAVTARSGSRRSSSRSCRRPTGRRPRTPPWRITLGILGGTFSPTRPGAGGDATLSLLTPHGWFLRGLGEMQGGGTIADALPAVGVLLAVGLVTGAIGFARARRLVAPR